MSLHSVPTEKLGIEGLLKKIATFYPQLNQIRNHDYGEDDVRTYIQTSDYPLITGTQYRAYILDTYYDEALLGEDSTISLSDALENLIPSIETYINDYVFD